ncbi:hypothetical protein LguiA_033996 [Lonicera macranthoides]
MDQWKAKMKTDVKYQPFLSPTFLPLSLPLVKLMLTNTPTGSQTLSLSWPARSSELPSPPDLDLS